MECSLFSPAEPTLYPLPHSTFDNDSKKSDFQRMSLSLLLIDSSESQVALSLDNE